MKLYSSVFSSGMIRRFTGSALGGLSTLLTINSQDPELRRKGRVLAIMLLGIESAMLVLAASNVVLGETQYNLTNGVLISLVLGLYFLNRSGSVRITSLLIVATTAVVPLLLVEESLVGTYVAMVLPILAASSLLKPWSGLVLLAVMIVGAFVYSVASLSLLIVTVIAIFSYLFAASIDRAYRENRYRALHDELTGLPNRRLFVDLLQHAIDRSGRDAKLCAVLFMDLDDFKVVNDSLGHETGDALLIQVAERLQRNLRPGVTAARLGGDEFTVLLGDIAGVEVAVRAAEQVNETIRLPIELGARQIVVTTSVGIALSQSADDQPNVLMRNADVAMYEAKKQGKARYKVFDPSMHVQALRRLELENDLRQAIKNHELIMHYQPIVLLGTGKITGMEALVRWKHPERGLVAPDEFIPLAEETGLIVPLGWLVLREASRQAHEWIEKYPDIQNLVISVNLSARQFQEPNLVEELNKLLREIELEPGQLQLEVTESAVADNAQFAVSSLHRLKELGIRLAIDDFGTGYSSLTSLRQFPLDAIKIDKEFVDELETDNESKAIVEHIINLAHSLDMQAVAEGVETVEQLVRLQDMGCDQAQGFYFWKALTGANTATLLGESPHWLLDLHRLGPPHDTDLFPGEG
jgi:diguanylate cyclase (GGDEF)-like protein